MRRHPLQSLTIHPKFSLIRHKTCEGELLLIELLRARVSDLSFCSCFLEEGVKRWMIAGVGEEACLDLNSDRLSGREYFAFVYQLEFLRKYVA